jgi:hypothetical protein
VSKPWRPAQAKADVTTAAIWLSGFSEDQALQVSAEVESAGGASSRNASWDPRSGDTAKITVEPGATTRTANRSALSTRFVYAPPPICVELTLVTGLHFVVHPL